MCAESNGASFMKIYIDHKPSYDHYFLYTQIDIIFDFRKMRIFN